MSNNQIDDEALESAPTSPAMGGTPDASSVPSLGGVDDNTLASPELGYGMQRVDFLDTRDRADVETRAIPRIPKVDDDVPETLGRNEVAAVSVDRTYYVSDQPSPYLTSRQAQEDVYETRRRRSTIVTAIVVACVVAALGAGGYFVWTFTKSDTPRQTVKYDTREIEFGEFVESIDATSIVHPIDERTIMPSINGTVAEAFVEEGAYVEAGAPLFRLDNPTVTDAVAKAEASLASYQSSADTANQALAGAEGELAKAQAAYDSVEQQLKEANAEDDESEEDSDDSEDSDDDTDDDSDSDSEKDDKDDKDDKDKKSKTKADPATIRALEESERQAESALKIARDIADRFRMEAETANANLYNVQESYYRAVEQQEMLTIYAPISGFVTDLNPAAAPSSAVSGSTHMCLVADRSSYRVQIEIPRESADRVSIGEEVRMAFPTIEDLSLTSSVASIDVNGESLVATTIIEQPDERISSGIAAEVSVVLNSIPDSLMVPLEALRTEEDGSAHLDVLLDATRNIVTDIPVTVVATNGTHAAVKAANIQRGNTVVVTTPPAPDPEG